MRLKTRQGVELIEGGEMLTIWNLMYGDGGVLLGSSERGRGRSVESFAEVLKCCYFIKVNEDKINVEIWKKLCWWWW